MENKNEIEKLKKELGAKSLKQEKDWNGYKLYSPQFSRFQGHIGYPDFILIDKTGTVRLSTFQEALEIMSFLYPEDEKEQS